MSVYNKNNKFISYLIVLITLFILVLFTKDEIMNIQENNDLNETYINELNLKNSKIEELNKLKKELSNTSEDIDKYKLEIKEDEIIDYLYSNIEDINDGSWVVLINNISIWEAIDTEIWFKETNINLNLRVPSEKKLKKVLDFLTSSDSKYNFFINSFTFPYGKDINWKYSVFIPLKVLYK